MDTLKNADTVFVRTNFLLALADLLEENNATLDYTIDDDGIHLSVGGAEVFVGFLSENAPEALRLAARKFE